jgi:hypothetical protein
VTKLPDFTKLPSAWIEGGGLRKFRWGNQGSDNLAALMLLVIIANHIDTDTGVARLTYGRLSHMASLARAKVAAGLDVLEARNLVERGPLGRSTYLLTGYNPGQGWAMLPARGLYDHTGALAAFSEFRLRRRAELDAMKLYLLFAARRSRQTNLATIGYAKIDHYAAVGENYIRPALTVLGANGLIHVERLPSRQSEAGVANGYRLCHLFPRMHMGTTGRREGAFANEADLF